MEAVRRIIDLGAAEIRKSGAEPVFVFLPAFQAFPERDPGSQARKGTLFAHVQEAGFAVVDVEPALRAAVADPRALFALGIDGHFTEDGHRVMAEAIAAGLARDQGVVW